MNSASSLHRHPPHERIQLYSCTRRIAPIPPPSRRLVSRASLPAPRWWDRRAGESPTVHHRPRPSKDAPAEDSQLPLSSESLPPNREPQRGGGKVSDPGQPGSSSLPLRATRHKLSAPTVFSPPAPRRWIRRGGECPPPSTTARAHPRTHRPRIVDSLYRSLPPPHRELQSAGRKALSRPGRPGTLGAKPTDTTDAPTARPACSQLRDGGREGAGNAPHRPPPPAPV